jgi:hypothetical protein
MKSADPPGAVGTMKRMGFAGYACAEACALASTISVQIATRKENAAARM